MNKEDLNAIRDLLKAELEPIKNDMKSIRIQQDEDHKILRALEHSSEVNKAERDNLNNDIAHISGHLKNIDENINAVKEILGRHEVDITVLKRRLV
ncbi:hypothetical protein ACJDU8_17520 [Clostridium sp. WILCCON 0269]|uniref:Uncharacterized protein n=1 Tax=Candidatus Clostridium eludens TaxID=3381663 RepID=A0ABW8SN05_9CLOT